MTKTKTKEPLEEANTKSEMATPANDPYADVRGLLESVRSRSDGDAPISVAGTEEGWTSAEPAPHHRLALSGGFMQAGDVRRHLRKQGFDGPLAPRGGEEELVYVDWRADDGIWLGDMTGGFAFVIQTPAGIVLARDPLGIRPLYVGRCRGKLIAGFDLEAILASAESVAEFPPGHIFVEGEGLKPYQTLPDGPPDVTHAPTARRETLQLLFGAVRAGCEQGGARAVLLSGGLSSSLVAALARRVRSDLRTFAAGMENTGDLRFARRVAKHLETTHEERVFTLDEAVAALPEIIRYLGAFDPRVVRAAIPVWFAAEAAAARGLEAVLSGDGADALFGGFPEMADRDAGDQQEFLVARTADLHRTALRRVDGVGRAHGLEIRLPYLDDPALVAYALHVAPRLKMRRGAVRAKWLLREVAKPFLPVSVLLRKRHKPAAGAGLGRALAQHADSIISDAAFARERKSADGVFGDSGASLDTKEALLYFRRFREAFPSENALPLVAG